MLLLAALFVASTFTACDNKEDKNDDPIAPKTANFNVNAHFKWGNAPFQGGTAQTLDDSTALTFTTARVILSDFHLIRNDGSIVHLNDTIGARIFTGTNGGMQMYKVGELLSGDFKGISFYVGLNDSINTLDPVTKMSEQHPLFDAPMHWGWNPAAGYKFVNLEGNGSRADSTFTFKYHIATSAAFTKVTAFENFSFKVDPNNGYTLNLDIDFKEVLKGFDVARRRGVHGGAADFKANLANLVKQHAHSVN